MEIVARKYQDVHHNLIEQCKQNHRKAQAELYQRYAKPMFNVCTRMLKDRFLAEDALQEAFVSAFKNIEKFRSDASFGSWLKRIVVNKCIDQINKNKIYFEELNENIQAIPIDNEEIDLKIKPAQLHNEIKNLPKGCRVIFTLYMLEGYDHEEITQILNVSLSTSKTQLHRAKKMLRSRLIKN